MTVAEFFEKFVDHAQDCKKGISSPTCTCGLMKNLPTILIYALEGEKNG